MLFLFVLSIPRRWSARKGPQGARLVEEKPSPIEEESSSQHSSSVLKHFHRVGLENINTIETNKNKTSKTTTKSKTIIPETINFFRFKKPVFIVNNHTCVFCYMNLQER